MRCCERVDVESLGERWRRTSTNTLTQRHRGEGGDAGAYLRPRGRHSVTIRVEARLLLVLPASLILTPSYLSKLVAMTIYSLYIFDR